MCGICGVVDPRASAEEIRARVGAMCARLVHRGPDEEGQFVQDGRGLGHRRLSIIDLAGGQQPITNEDGSLVVVFNGEIYNYLELRAELEGKGHVFRTASDTESIVHLYEEEGPEGFRRLRGQFAVAVLHRETGELVVARDHLGLKPVFYGWSEGRLHFASELKALRAVGLGNGLNPRAVEQFMVLRYVCAPESIYADVRKLRAGHYLRWKDGELEERAFYRWPSRVEGEARSDEAWAQELGERLRESVRLRMQADVPFGAFLSGGLDSSLIVGLMSERVQPVRTFSVGFKRKGYHEFPYSRQVSRAFGSEHVEHVVGAEEFEAAVRSVQGAVDEPIGDPAFAPLYCLARRTREKVTVVLSGEGADELFGGYGRYVEAARGGGPAGEAAFRAHLAGCAYQTEGIPLSEDVRRELGGYSTVDALREVYGPQEGESALQAALRFDLRSWIADNLLVKADRMGMAHSLEVRVPFLDVPLVEWAATVPDRLKIHPVERRRWWGKREQDWEVKALLKAVARPVVPAAVVRRTKMGFPVPVRRLLRGELRGLAQEVLGGSRLAESGVFDPKHVQRTLTRFFEQGKSSWPVWTLLCFELWREAQDEVGECVG